MSGEPSPKEYAEALYFKAIRLLPYSARFVPKSWAIHFIKIGFLAGYQVHKFEAAQGRIDGLKNLREAFSRLRDCIGTVNDEKKWH